MEFTGGLNAYKKPLEPEAKKNWDAFWDNLEEQNKKDKSNSVLDRSIKRV